MRASLRIGLWALALVALVLICMPQRGHANVIGGGGSGTVQGFSGMSPLAARDVCDANAVNGPPVCSFTFSAGDTCVVGGGTISGTGCAIVGSTACSFTQGATYKWWCNVAASHENGSASSATASSTIDLPWPAYTAACESFVQATPYWAGEFASSGQCVIYQLNSF